MSIGLNYVFVNSFIKVKVQSFLLNIDLASFALNVRIDPSWNLNVLSRLKTVFPTIERVTFLI